jgi:hypothetical protein
MHLLPLPKKHPTTMVKCLCCCNEEFRNLKLSILSTPLSHLLYLATIPGVFFVEDAKLGTLGDPKLS